MRISLVSALMCATIAAAVWTFTSSRGSDAAWLRVAHDSSYDIAIDTTRITKHYGSDVTVWYRTNHSVTHLYRGKAFDREVVQSLLHCGGTMRFKVVSVDMSLGNGALIAQQRTEDGELGRQLWREVEEGTIEAIAAHAACALGQTRVASRR
jgi:hypothetical protein